MSHEKAPRSVPFRVTKGVGITMAAASLFLGANIASSLAGDDAQAERNRGYIADAWHHVTSETSQEKRIADGLALAFGQKAMVRCAEVPQSVAAEKSVHQKYVAGVTRHGALWGIDVPPSIILPPEVCDTITTLADGDVPSTKKSWRYASMAASVPVHEAHHGFDEELNEAKANCYAARHLPTFMETMGASEGVASELQATFIQNVNKLSPTQYQVNFANCPV